MYDTSVRVTRVQARVRQLRRKRDKNTIVGLSALCLALLSCLVGTMSALMDSTPSATPGMYGSMLLYQNAGGYVLVGVVSFTVAMVVTALCIKYRNKEKKQNKEEENRK